MQLKYPIWLHYATCSHQVVLTITSYNITNITHVPVVSPSSHQVVLTLQRRVVETRSYFPPEEFIWDSSKGVTPQLMRVAIAEHIGSSVDEIVIAKHFPEKYEWLVIKNEHANHVRVLLLFTLCLWLTTCNKNNTMMGDNEDEVESIWQYYCNWPHKNPWALGLENFKKGGGLLSEH